MSTVEFVIELMPMHWLKSVGLTTTEDVARPRGVKELLAISVALKFVFSFAYC